MPLGFNPFRLGKSPVETFGVAGISSQSVKYPTFARKYSRFDIVADEANMFALADWID